MKKILTLIIVSISIQPLALEKVIYGTDDRFENRRSPFARFSNSIAAMIPNKNLKISLQTGRYHVKKISDHTTHLGVRTCEEVRFRNQPTVADCTGFLIDDQTLVTAGHCVLDFNQSAKNIKNTECSNNQWIFGYEDNDYFFAQMNFSETDVYGCQKIIDAKYNEKEDYAVIKLNKTTSNRQNLLMSSSELNYEVDSNIFVIGHPSGLPLKVAASANVKSNLSANEFVTDLDTFGGNSGSPIFNDYGEVIGILVSGEIDYFLDPIRNCYRPNICDGYQGRCDKSEGAFARGESATKIHLVQKILREIKNELNLLSIGF